MADTYTDISEIARVTQEVLGGDALSPAQAGRMLHKSPAGTWRLMREGCRLSDGQIVRLAACRVGVRWLTSRAAVERFVARVTEGTIPPLADRTDGPAVPSPRTLERRRKAAEAAAEAAGRKLAAMGA